MCLAVPSRIISIDNLIATIDVYGARKQISLMLLPDAPRVGDYSLRASPVMPVFGGKGDQSIRGITFRYLSIKY